MRYLAILFAGIGMLGCAHQTTTTSGARDDLGKEFVNAVAPQSLRVVESSRSDCPRSANAVKAATWKVQVKAANACVLSGQWNMVESLGNQLAQTHHLGPWGAYYLGLAAEHRNDLGRAAWMNELALKKAPKNGLLIFQQGRLQWLSRDQAAALKSFQAAIEADPRLTDAHMILGQQALLNNDLKTAATRFQSAVSIEPRHLPALLGVAEVAMKGKDSKVAGEALAQAIFHHPGSFRARLKQAQVFEILEKNFPQALEAYKRMRGMEKEKKLDAQVDFDLEGKIRQLEGAVKEVSPNQLSQRDPAEDKKVEK